MPNGRLLAFSIETPEDPEGLVAGALPVLSQEPATGMGGTVEVRDGRLYVVNPLGQGSPARLLPGDHICAAINGVEYTYPTEILHHDHVTLETKAERWCDRLGITVSPDQMTATLQVGRGLMFEPYLPDCPPAQEYKPEILERQTATIDEAVAMVLAALAKNGVLSGIDEAAVRTALEEPFPLVTVAQGRPPVEPQHGKVRQMVSEEVQVTGPRQREDGTVDYREVLEIPSVNPGDVVAVVEKAVAGVPGHTVTGAVLEVPAAKDVQLVLGRGVEFDAATRRVLAAAPGRPQVNHISPHRVAIKVVSEYVHQGDVSLSTGNIDFNGDVLITGDVTETMTVRAARSVKILGSASKAQIYAGLNIELKGGAINSTLRAGGVRAVYVRILPELQSLLEDLGGLHAAIMQVEKRFQQLKMPLDVKLDQAAATLRAKYLPYMSQRTSSIWSAIKESDLPVDSDLTALADDLAAAFSVPTKPETFSGFVDELRRLETQVDDAVSTIAGITAQPCSIKTGYAHLSTLESPGIISLGERGAYCSKLVAQGDCDVRGPVTGGLTLSLSSLVRAVAMGSPAEAKTEVRVSEKGVIRCDTAYPGVTLRMGRATIKITSKELQVRAHKGPDGMFVLR
jgi:hypothetical protein